MRTGKVGLVIQARMGSTRLPGKVLMTLGTESLLGHIVRRCRRVTATETVILATTTCPEDDVLATWAEEHSLFVFRGSPDNVLDRYRACAEAFDLDAVVRLTGDNPFVDDEEITRMIQLFEEKQPEAVLGLQDLPVGAGAEMFSRACLSKLWHRSSQPHHFEHVDEYLLESPDEFHIEVLEVPEEKRWPDVRLTVDTAEDLERARFIVEQTGEMPSTREAVRWARVFDQRSLRKETV